MRRSERLENSVIFTGGSNQNAFIGGNFFNDGTDGVAPGSSLGDVYAAIIMLDTTVTAAIGRFTGPFFAPFEIISGVIPIGSVTPGSSHDLSVALDGGNFVFQLDDEDPVIFDTGAAG